ncbi:MAG: ribonuclease [Gammaproteobacteria bacterium]|nr:ribonuclease [Sideroxydans sp.]MBU4046253.1 ribonuclease [Gammaproteobacteria bacterium]
MRRAAQAGWGLLIALLLCLPFAQASDQPPHPLAVVSVAQLPPEARDTLQRIQRGGPFPYARDGITFKNRERILPPQQTGYYREYTVSTPGVSHRGARRIVCGIVPECYYSADHYRSFKRIKE